jgi:TPR repeat protein
MRSSIVLLLGVALANGCGGPGPGATDAASCPHGVVTTRADYDQVVYQLDAWCQEPTQTETVQDAARANRSPLLNFVGQTCTIGGSAFEAGKCGMPRDLDRARLYYRRGCAAGYPPACSAAQRLGG